MKYNRYPKRDALKDYFPVPNEIFCLGLSTGEIAVYAYLMYRDADLTEDSNMTLGEWLDRWINEYIIFTIRESTLDSYKAMIKNQIKPYLGDRPLSALTTQELQKFYNTVKKNGRVKPDKLHGTELADRMVRGCHSVCRKGLEKAVKEGLIRVNSTIGCKLPPKKAREM